MPVNKREYWNEEEINKFIFYYPNYTNEYLLKEIFKNRTRISLINMAIKFKLNKNFNTNAKGKDKRKEMALLNLKRVFDEKGFTPLSTELSLYGLPSETTYRRYFGSYRKACVIAGVDINISIFGKSIAGISSKNDICLSKAELLITEFFIKSKIYYEKDKKYRDIGTDYSGNKTCDWYFVDKNIIVEYFGLPEKREYKRRMIEKRNLCNSFDIRLIELYRKDLKENKLSEIFKNYIP